MCFSNEFLAAAAAAAAAAASEAPLLLEYDEKAHISMLQKTWLQKK